MKKIVAFLFVTFTLLQVSCNKDECKSVRYFNVTGLRMIPMAVDASQPNNPQYTTIYKNGSAKVEDFYLDGYLVADYYSRTTSSGFSFMPQAYATDCASPGFDGSKESIANISFISRGNFNNYPPGSDIKNVIRINQKTVEEYLQDNANGIKDQYLIVTLTERPDPSAMQAFTFILELQNGEIYKALTPGFYLK